MHHTRPPAFLLGVVLLSLAAAACSSKDDAIDSDEAARRAYLGLDPSIEKSLNLGFDGFNSATSANIAPQTAPGDEAGTLTISGQVDQGVSDNKEMRLRVGMVDYSDGILILVVDDDEVEVDLAYDTSEAEIEQPFLELKLRNIPNGTFTGTLTGIYFVRGDLEGEVELDLVMSGNLQPGAGDTVVRVPGSTSVSGTATSGDGVFEVNITL
jgi:hypothetical protein